MRLTLRQLEVFCAIARTENVSRAATQLAMSQSAASSALVELERAYDSRLFDRIGKALRLNSQGRGVLPLAEHLLAQARLLEEQLGSGGPGPVSLGATLTIANYLMPGLLAAYQARFPAALIELVTANTETIVGKMLRYQCDLALVEGDVQHPDLVVQPWQEDELVIFCAPQHPLAGLAAVDTAALAQEAWVLRERGSGTRSWFDQRVARVLGGLRINFELEHAEAIKNSVALGLGIGCLSRLVLRDAFLAGQLVPVHTPQFDLRRPLSIVRHRNRPESLATRELLHICAQQAGNQGA